MKQCGLMDRYDHGHLNHKYLNMKISAFIMHSLIYSRHDAHFSQQQRLQYS